MKNEYRTPEMEVTRFETGNIITESDGDGTEIVFPNSTSETKSGGWFGIE